MKQLWIYFLNGSINLILENTRITAKRAVVREDSLKISVHARIHDTTYGIVNPEDTTDVILSGVIIQDTNPFQPIFHIMV